MSFDRKVDSEPGRCRRTDGKKWRCSKEAYPDSKYCERHMHRGRNRSRKHVELVSSTTTLTAITSTNNNTNLNTNISEVVIPSYNRNTSSMTNNPINMPPSASSFSYSPLPSSIASGSHHQHFSQTYQNNTSLNPFFYTQTTPSVKSYDSDFPPQDATTTHQQFMDSGSYCQDEKDHRHIHGIREGVDERSFFPEASGSARTYPTESYHQQLSMSSYRSYSNSQFQNINDKNNNPSRQQEQHCFVLGTDFKSNRPSNKEKESETTHQRPLHHFFGEWPPKNTDSWLDLASNSTIP